MPSGITKAVFPLSRKSIVWVVGGFVGLLVVVAVVLLLLVDVNAYKPRLEASASRALGMEVKVNGQVGIGFLPGLVVTLEDVRIRNRGTDFASVEKVRLGVSLMSLLQRKLRTGQITLGHASISIERDPNGKFNFERSQPTGETVPAMHLAKVSVSDGSLVYADKGTGKGFEAGDCSVDLQRMRLSAGPSADIMKNLSVSAEIACGRFQRRDFAASDLKLSVEGKDGIFDLKPVTMRVFGAQGSGSVQANFVGTTAHYRVHYTLPQFNIEEFFKTLSPKKVAEGKVDFSAELSMEGKTVHEMIPTMEGQFLLRGQNLTLIGSDLDREFSRYESSQNFNLVDVGAFFFAGPFGLAVTKGYNFASIFQGSGGNSDIRTLVSDWKVERGVARAQDVAMATKKNRIALHGGLDFVNEQYEDVTMALVDSKGCAVVRQRIRGTFHEPVVEQPGFLRSVTGPALKLLKKGRDLFPGGECDVFYAGSVAPPK